MTSKEPAKLILRELNENDEVAFFEGMADWSKEDRHWYTFEWEEGLSFPELLERLKDYRSGLNLPEGRVPSTMLYAFVDGRIVGRVSLRHQLNDFLRERGGHIGYSVAEKFRRRGYANEMLKQALTVCRRLGIPSVLLTCADSNVSSWKTIEKTGGILASKAYDDEHKETIRRYWIHLELPGKAAFEPQPTIETSRLVLRPLDLKDVERFQMLANDEKISGTTSHPFPYTIGHAEERVVTERSRFHKGESVYFALSEKKTGNLIGAVMLFGITKPVSKAELGYWIGVDFWNKGYATEAVKAALDYGFDRLGLNRIFAKYVATNEASGKVLIKNKMRKEGVLREDVQKNGVTHNLVYCGILKNGWKS